MKQCDDVCVAGRAGLDARWRLSTERSDGTEGNESGRWYFADGLGLAHAANNGRTPVLSTTALGDAPRVGVQADVRSARWVPLQQRRSVAHVSHLDNPTTVLCLGLAKSPCQRLSQCRCRGFRECRCTGRTCHSSSSLQCFASCYPRRHRNEYPPEILASGAKPS